MLFSIAPDDYEAVVSQTVTITAGNTVGFVTVDIASDSIGENDEMFRAILTSPSANAVLGEDVATVTISDTTDVRVEFNPITYSENENAGMITFTIVKLDQSERPVSVLFNTAVGSAQGNGRLV